MTLQENKRSRSEGKAETERCPGEAQTFHKFTIADASSVLQPSRWRFLPASSVCHLPPCLVRIKQLHHLSNFWGLFPEILLIDNTVMVDDKGHDP